MSCVKRIKDIFFAEEAKKDSEFISNIANFVLAGMSIWHKHSRFVIPSALVGLFGVVMLQSIVLHSILYYDSLDWFNKIIDFGWPAVYLSAMYIILYHKEEIKSLSEDLDRWWEYAYMEKETAGLKKSSEDWMRKFNFYYFGCGTISWAFYISLPAVKIVYMNQEDRGDALIFAAWTPFPLDTTWGYFVTYGWQMLTMAFALCAYSQLFQLLMTFVIVIGRQMRLVGIAFVTILDRTDKIMKDMTFESSKEFYEVWNLLLDKELRNGVIHFQYLYRSSFRLSRTFSSITNITYHGGMWVMCSVGVKAASEMTFVIMLQASMMIGIVILNQYVYSFVNECLIEEVEKLRNVAYDSPWYKMPSKSQKQFHIFLGMLDSDRFPSLRTIMGNRTNMENLSKVINASYCYFSMLITIKTS